MDNGTNNDWNSDLGDQSYDLLLYQYSYNTTIQYSDEFCTTTKININYSKKFAQINDLPMIVNIYGVNKFQPNYPSSSLHKMQVSLLDLSAYK